MRILGIIIIIYCIFAIGRDHGIVITSKTIAQLICESRNLDDLKQKIERK